MYAKTSKKEISSTTSSRREAMCLEMSAEIIPVAMPTTIEPMLIRKKLPIAIHAVEAPGSVPTNFPHVAKRTMATASLKTDSPKTM